MKAKNLSKVLAFLVAAVMIFSALPLMAFATDEANTYTVSFGAPAIPMDVDTKVDLKTLNVEMVKGEAAVSGADITWAADAQDGLTLDAVNKTVEVTAVGNYKLTATVDGGTPKNIWVIAKPADQEKIYLVNIPTLNAATFDTEDWAAFGSYNKTNVTVEGAISSKYITFADDYMTLAQVWGTATAEKKGGTVVYVNEIFNDFVDYTVETQAAAKGGQLTVDQLGSGVGGRIALDANGTAYTTAVLAYIRQCKQIAINRTSMDYGPHGVNQGTGSDGKYHTWETSNEFHKVVGIFDGANVKYSYDSETLFDSSTTSPCCSNSGSNKNCILKNVQPAAGYPAMVGWGTDTYFKSFCVYLNSTAMPTPMTDEPVAPAPEADITIVSGVGTGTATVEAVVGSENTYTVTLAPADGYKVKVGSLVINGKPAVDKNSTDSTGLKYTFTTDDLDSTTIAVEYIVDDGKLNTAMLGATIPTNPEVKGIRFGARTDSIKRSAGDATKGLLNDTINVDGKDYTITDIGMILFPTAPLGDAELTVATDGVVRQSVTKIVALTDGYSDIAITLIDIPDTMLEVQITSRMYVAYTDANGATQYVYSNAISKSYDDVVKAIAQ